MNRNTGLLGAIALALVTIFSFFVASPGKEEPTTTPSTQTVPTINEGVVPQPSAQKLRPACEAIRKQIVEFIPDKLVAPPPSCWDDSKKPGANLPGTSSSNEPDLHYVIATLPDPVHTHFPLLFDRLTEALQQAAQDQGYNYNGSWLPWDTKGHSDFISKSHGLTNLR